MLQLLAHIHLCTQTLTNLRQFCPLGMTEGLDDFYIHVTVHRNKFLFNKTNRRNNFPNLFCQ